MRFARWLFSLGAGLALAVSQASAQYVPSYQATPYYGAPAYPITPYYGAPAYPAAPYYGAPAYPTAQYYRAPAYPATAYYGAPAYPTAQYYQAAAYPARPYSGAQVVQVPDCPQPVPQCQPAVPPRCDAPPAVAPPPADLKLAPKEEPIPAPKEPAPKEPAPTPDLTAQASQPPPSEAFAQPPPAGGAEAASFAPNMFGDQFGSGRLRFTLQPPPLIIPAVPGTPGVQLRLGGQFTGGGKGSTGPLPFTAAPANNFLTFTTNSPVTIFGTTVNPPVVFSSQNPATLGTATVGLAPNAADQQATLAQAVRQAGPGGTLVYLPSASLAQLIGGNNLYSIQTFYDYLISGTPGIPGQVIPRGAIFIDVANPAGGGVVGRVKIAEDSNPLPRDRFIFDYDYFSNTPLVAGGFDVHRFALGVEKTFFDRRMSFEVRVPFASTLDSSSTQGFESRSTELGNIRLSVKGLLWRSEVLNVASGLGIHLPTANDTRVALPTGVEIVRIENEAVILTPFIAVLYTPNSRLFAQAWMSWDFDPSGNPVLVNTDLTGLSGVGRLTDQTFMQVDAQVGFWVVQTQDASRWLRGLAPFLELHYNTTLQNPDVITVGAFSIGDLSGRRDELNLSAGVVARLGGNFLLSIGASTPLRTGDDRSFDFQLGVRGSLFFGPTARQSNAPAQAPSSF